MSSIKKSNRTRILEFVFRNAPVSRATIAENTDITPATVTTTTATLISEGLIVNLGEAEQASDNTLGRKRVLIDFSSDYAYGVGIEFNEKHIAFCITNLKGRIVDEILFPTTYKAITNITEFIIDNLDILMSRNVEITSKLVGIGIALPGKLSNNQTQLISDSAVWQSFQPQKIKEKFCLPIIMDNNVRCMAFGQYLFETQNTPENFAFFHVGIGMYCANMINGELFKADNYIAGEIGHTIVKVDGKSCECGKNGCLQTYASERWLIKAAKILVENKSSIILNSLVKTKEEVNVEHIITAYNLGDEIIRQYILDALKYLSMTISNVSITINPTKIFLHGRLFHDQEIQRQLQVYLDKDLNFMGEQYASNIEILPYTPIKGAAGASARAIDAYFINE